MSIGTGDHLRVPPAGRWRRSLPNLRNLAVQGLIVAAIVAVVWFLIGNIIENLHNRSVTTGFAFLWRISNLPIDDGWLDYAPGVSTYGKAILVGLINTINVSLIVIVSATVLGTFIGIARLSPNWLLSRACATYVEALRNVPVLVQLFFWYQLILQLPGPRAAIQVLDCIFISNRGIRFPMLRSDPGQVSVFLACLVGTAIAIAVARWNRLRREQTGHGLSLWPLYALLVLAAPVLTAWFANIHFVFEIPELKGFNIHGGATLKPELSALAIGLCVYTSAFVAEIVRAGIEGVPRGQWEASSAIGLNRVLTLQKVVLPQALRIIVPPLGNEYLGIVKNSTLAVAVGYPDLVTVISNVQSDTGQALEGLLIVMVAYLAISFVVSVFMNSYNRHVALVTR